MQSEPCWCRLKSDSLNVRQGSPQANTALSCRCLLCGQVKERPGITHVTVLATAAHLKLEVMMTEIYRELASPSWQQLQFYPAHTLAPVQVDQLGVQCSRLHPWNQHSLVWQCCCRNNTNFHYMGSGQEQYSSLRKSSVDQIWSVKTQRFRSGIAEWSNQKLGFCQEQTTLGFWYGKAPLRVLAH